MALVLSEGLDGPPLLSSLKLNKMANNCLDKGNHESEQTFFRGPILCVFL